MSTSEHSRKQTGLCLTLIKIVAGTFVTGTGVGLLETPTVSPAILAANPSGNDTVSDGEGEHTLQGSKKHVFPRARSGYTR